MNGVLCVYKPRGYTSFDIIAITRRLFSTKKAGHSGTLDPMAEGVLPVFIGAATKAVDYCPDTDKEYRAAFRLGISTDTQDITGRIISEKIDFSITEEEVETALKNFTGEISQIPPMFSAVKVNGQKLCNLARAGKSAERKPRRITVYSADIESYGDGEGVINIKCSKGTYVRTIIHDLGALLGTGAVMTGLVRVRANGFSTDDCRNIEELRGEKIDKLREYLLPLDRIFDSYPRAYLDLRQTEMFRNGVRIDTESVEFDKIYDGIYAIYDYERNLSGLGKIDGGLFAVFRRFSL